MIEIKEGSERATQSLATDTEERIQEVIAQIAEVKTKVSDRSKGQDKSLRVLVERLDQVDKEILEAAANSENAGRGTARRLDELDKLVPL